MRRKLLFFAAAAIAVMLCMTALAQASISTTVTMRVSKLTQNAVVNLGEDLSIEIAVDGVEPASYQWYFNDAPILDAKQPVYTLGNAGMEDAGIYRMDAFDAEGKMLVSMDMVVRVVEQGVPKAGDASQPVAAAMLGGAALLGLAGVGFRRRSA